MSFADRIAELEAELAGLRQDASETAEDASGSRDGAEPGADAQQAALTLLRWHVDPVSMVRELFAVTPDRWEADVLNDLSRGQRVALQGSKGVGKSTVPRWATWWFLLTRASSKIAIVSISGDALADTLWTELALWYSKSPILRAAFDMTKTRISSKTAPETWFASARTWPRSAASLAQNAFVNYGVIMSITEAKDKLDAFFRRFPRLAQWRNENATLCRAQGLVRIGCGRVVEASWEQSAENPFGSISFPQCCNLPVQGICADAMLHAIRLVHQRFLAAQINGGLVATIHDELLCEVAEEDAERAREILQQAMLDAFVVTFPGAPTNDVAKAEIGNNWAEL